VVDFAGNPIADTRQQKPEIVAPDGGDTTFFGGSISTAPAPASPGLAAAPHAAAVAACSGSAAEPDAGADAVRAGDDGPNMGAVGFDTTTGSPHPRGFRAHGAAH
jgi:hypothetical protein